MLKPVMSKKERELKKIRSDVAKRNFDEEYMSFYGPPDGANYHTAYDNLYGGSPEVIVDNLHDEYLSHQLPLNEDDYNNKSNNYISEYQKVECKYFLNHETNTDLIKRKELIDILSQIICENSFPKSNFNIGIYGEWGSGKSTFLNLLKKELSSTNKFRIVEVDASEYEDEHKIWYNILKCMFIEYENTYWFPKIRFELSKIKRRSKKFFLEIILPKITAMAILFCTFYTNFLNDLDSIGNLYKSSIGIVAIIIGFIQIIVPLVNTVKRFSIPLSKSLSKIVELPNFDSKLGDRESVKTYLETLQKSWGNKHIILMVDELDRCSKEGVIEFFKAIQIMNRIPNMNIIFAVDQEYLIAALADCTNVKKDKYIDFFDKYIHFSVALNNKFDRAKYASLLIENSNLTDSEKNILCKILKKPCCSNLTPRKIKKMINYINLYKIIANTNNFKSNTIIIFDRFIVWYIMSVLFPKETNDLYECSVEKNYFTKLEDFIQDLRQYKQLYDNNFIDELKELVVMHLYEFESLRKTGESMMDMSVVE